MDNSEKLDLELEKDRLNGDKVTIKYEEEEEENDKLEYDVDEYPPWFVTITTAFQYTFLCIGSVLSIVTILSDLICADLNDPVRARLFSSSVLIIGLSTAAQSYFGLRLPIFQGASSTFMIPLIALRGTDEWKCPVPQTVGNMTNMTSSNLTASDIQSNIVYDRLAELQGSLIAASMFEVVIGITGLIGVLIKFISPITIGVTIFCLGYALYPVVIFLCGAHWGLSIIGCALTVVMSMYMAHIKVPQIRCRRKAGTKSKGFPVFQVFPILITLVVMWIVCVICTQFDVFSHDENHPSYKARTDVRNKVIRDTPWILIPYPGQFGKPGFNSAIFLGFLISIMTSVIESVGDYIATSRVCHAYPVPRYAINRGIAMEGIFSVLSGAYGTAHATTSYGTGISLVGLTKIGSRIVLVVAGLLAVILAIIGKLGAFMTSVPDPILGGIALAMVGVLCSIGISAFQSVQLRSSRNLSVIGVSIYSAIVLSEWQRQYPDSLKTDSMQLNQFVKVTLGNAMFIGFVMSLILDNTVKGNDRDRGISKEDSEEAGVQSEHDDSRAELFKLPFIHSLQKRFKLLRHLPFFQPFRVSYSFVNHDEKNCDLC